jgi:DNA repair protein RadC
MATDPPAVPSRAEPAFVSTGPQGHRGRMRTRLLSSGPVGLADYEVLEMLLFFSIPRRDTKPLAKSIINRFGDLYRVLQARAAELSGFGLDTATIGVIELVREAARRLALAEAVSRPLLNDNAGLLAYLDPPARLRRPPHVAVLLLNNRNQLLADLAFTEEQDPADIVQAVATQAVLIHATAVILASFRTGPGLEPSYRDRDLTDRMTKVGAALSLVLHDHMIFGAAGRDSFRRRGML